MEVARHLAPHPSQSTVKLGRYPLPPFPLLTGKDPAPRRPGLPAFVNPEPLVRIKTNHALNRGGKASCVYLDIFVVVAGSNQLNRRVAMKK